LEAVLYGFRSDRKRNPEVREDSAPALWITMSASRHRKVWLILAGTAVALLVAGAVAIMLLNLTRYVESDAFRAELEKQTAKGLHFPSGHYAPIRRTGFLTAQSDGFRAENGRKAMTKMEAHGITARFNPWGVFLRRWQLDEVHIESGEVGIQTYEPKPEPSPAKPWFSIFLPDRVYLKRVWSEPADVTWRLRDEPAGFFGTRLLITPHGRDFEYQATGGTMKMALIPDLHLRHTHLLITKTLLTLYRLDLAPDEKSDGIIHAEGRAGTREDKSVHFELMFERLPVHDWVPAAWQDHFTGTAFGEIDWVGKNPKLESSTIRGSLQVRDGRVAGLPFLEKLASITKKKSIEHLELNECSLDLDWNSPRVEIKSIAIEDRGKFRIEGSASINQKSLGGTIDLGVAHEYLEWFPNAEEVFTRERDGYLWTRVHLSGTTEKPEEDLSPRIIEVLKESPGALLGVFFRQVGDWLKKAFGGE
jgi:hypothetical protein